MQQLAIELGLTEGKTEKLTPNLSDKKKYVVYLKNLQLYLDLGLKIEKIHRVISFNQAPWLKRYIDFNTEQRQQAKNTFEKDFWKLMNNAVFGKFMENIRNRIDVKFCFIERQVQRQIANPLCKNWQTFDNNLVIVEKVKKEVVLNRPIVLGFCILDLSKYLMYDFHYNVIQKKYTDKAKLLYTDTDSLVYQIETEDLFNNYLEMQDLFDFSEFPKDHQCYSKKNAKVIGKFKCETQGTIIPEWVALRAKMYSFETEKGKAVKKAKGIKKSAMKSISHSDYKRVLFPNSKEDMVQDVTFQTLYSKKHKIETGTTKKRGLCAFDDKRYYLDLITSRAHRHYLNSI